MKCAKCGEAQAVRNAAETPEEQLLCPACLRTALMHRVKACLARGLRKSAVRPPRVAVALSSSSSSSSAALLALLVSMFPPDNPRSPFAICAAIHVVSSDGGDSAPPASFGVPLRVVALPAWVARLPAGSAVRAEAQGVALPPLLAREAAAAGAQALATGETAARMAALALADTALGRGARVAARTAPVDAHTHAPLVLLRPLRDTFREDALAAAGIAAAAAAVAAPAMTATVDGICSAFVGDLLRPFPQTAHAVLGTVGRLDICASSSPQCALCRCFMVGESGGGGDDAAAPLLCRACSVLASQCEAEVVMIGGVAVVQQLH